MFNRIEELNIPVIMAVNGFALGGGLELALSGDMILASENAKFGQPEVNLGVIPGYGGTQRLARLIGKQAAKYLCMTGEMISAEEARRLGIVYQVFPSDQLLPKAKELAQLLAKKAPLAVRFVKKRSIREQKQISDPACKWKPRTLVCPSPPKTVWKAWMLFLKKRAPV